MRRHIRGGIVASATSAAVIIGGVLTATLPHHTHPDLRYLDGGTATGALLLGLLLAFAGTTAVRAFNPDRRPHRETTTIHRRPAHPQADTAPAMPGGSPAWLGGPGRPKALEAAVPEPVPMLRGGCGKRF